MRREDAQAAAAFFLKPHPSTLKPPMPVDREQIENIRCLALAQLVELRAGPKPTYTIDGQTVSWESYVKSLEATVDWCDQKLIGLDPFEVRSQGYT